jgi:hypothetical protein
MLIFVVAKDVLAKAENGKKIGGDVGGDANF